MGDTKAWQHNRITAISCSFKSYKALSLYSWLLLNASKESHFRRKLRIITYHGAQMTSKHWSLITSTFSQQRFWKVFQFCIILKTGVWSTPKNVVPKKTGKHSLWKMQCVFWTRSIKASGQWAHKYLSQWIYLTYSFPLFSIFNLSFHCS